MRIDVVGRNLEVTEAIRSYAENKASRLPKYYDGVQAVVLRLTHADHHKKGVVYDAELVIDVQKHQDFISHAKGEDVYAIIDEVVQKGVRQLAEFKEQLKTGKR